MIQTEEQLNKELNKTRIKEKLIFLRFHKSIYQFELIEFDLRNNKTNKIGIVNYRTLLNKKTIQLKNWVTILMGLERTNDFNYYRFIQN